MISSQLHNLLGLFLNVYLVFSLFFPVLSLLQNTFILLHMYDYVSDDTVNKYAIQYTQNKSFRW